MCCCSLLFCLFILIFFSFHSPFILVSFSCLYCGKNHLSYYTVGCRRQEYKPLVLCFCFLLPVGAHIDTRRWSMLPDLSYIRLRCHSAQYTHRQCGWPLADVVYLPPVRLFLLACSFSVLYVPPVRLVSAYLRLLQYAGLCCYCHCNRRAALVLQSVRIPLICRPVPVLHWGLCC